MPRIEVTYRMRCLSRQASAGLWVTYCPSLRIFSQGTVEAEAKSTLEDSIRMYLATCYRRGILDRELTRRGLVPLGPGEDAARDAAGGGDFIEVSELPDGLSFADAKSWDALVPIDLAVLAKMGRTHSDGASLQQ